MKFFIPLLFVFLISCSSENNSEFKNSYLFEKAKAMSDFELETKSGTFTKENLKNKITVIYFGFTSCPDICPMELSLLGEAFKKLSESEQTKVQGLFVSVDPQKDSLEIVDNYATFFHPNFIGSRINHPAKLLSFTTQLGAYYEKVQLDDENYTMNHTSSFTIIDPNGLYAGLSPTPHTLEDLVFDIQSLIQYYF